MKLVKKQGFTMVELLVVLIIVGILAAVATPLYLANVKRARMSEAVSTMALIRQAQRDYKVNHNGYFDVAKDGTPGTTRGNIQGGLPSSADANGGPGGGVDLSVGTSTYFSNGSYWVEATNTSGAVPAPTGLGTLVTAFGTTPDATDFIIVADGNLSAACTALLTNSLHSCATKSGEVSGYLAGMDNSGRTFVSYDNATTWSAY